ncbi:MAG TPA: serine/threonine-protein kinase [Byssovorax sp.]|jgi:serine/threonine-protein kinase
MLDSGHILAGKYKLIEKLADGGMGSVWRAEHVGLRSQVAVKLIHQSVIDAADGQRRFLTEAHAAAHLRSPHVVQILDHGIDDGVPYMVMELLDGESLAQRLDRCGTLTLAQTSTIVTQVARAIGKAHEAGIIHRDLKPDNVFLVKNDDEELAKVLDFGIAKIANTLGAAASPSTHTGALLGTPYYMSPEQARGHKLDHRTDLWSLAVIAFECVTGRRPFDAETMGDLLLEVCTSEVPVPSEIAGTPAAFDAWFARGVARPPDERFQSARELAQGLRAIAFEGAGPTSGATGDRASLPGPLSAPARSGFPHDAETVSQPNPLLLDGRGAAHGVVTAPDKVSPADALDPTIAPPGDAPRRRASGYKVVAAVAVVAAAAVAWFFGGGARSTAAAVAPEAKATAVAPPAASASGDGVVVAPDTASPPAVAPASASPDVSATPTAAPRAASTRAPRAVAPTKAHPSAARATPPSAPAAPAQKKDELAF